MKIVRENDMLFYRNFERLHTLRRVITALIILGGIIAGFLFYCGFISSGQELSFWQKTFAYRQTLRTIAIVFSVCYLLLMTLLLNPGRSGQPFSERLFGMGYPKVLLRTNNRAVPCQVRLLLWNNQQEKNGGEMDHKRYGAVVKSKTPLTLQFQSAVPEAIAITGYQLSPTPSAGAESFWEADIRGCMKTVYAVEKPVFSHHVEEGTVHLTPIAALDGRYFIKVLCSFGTGYRANLMEIAFVLQAKEESS